MPAHLVPSPRRLAKLQADGQVTEHLSAMQIPTKVPENQSLAPSQNQELTQEGAAPQKGLSPESQVSAEPPAEPSPSAPGLQKAQDLSPDRKEGGAQQSALSSKTAPTNPPENEAQTSEVKAGEEGQPATTPSQGPLQHPDPPPAQSPQLDQDEEPGEARVTPSSPPCSELPQGSDPASFSPQGIQEGETGSASLQASSSHHDPPRDLSGPDGPDEVKPGPPPGGSQQPPEEGVLKAEVARVDTPYPEMPHPQDSTDTQQTQDRGEPVTLPPRSRLAPTRLPQPRVLAPFQSRRRTPKLLSPSREEALRTASDQTVTPSPRPQVAQDEDPSKLPLISSPHSKQPPNLSPHQGPGPQQVQEVKLPLISPPVQEPSAAPHPPQEGETHLIKLPRISTPFSEQLPQNMAPSDLRSAKERQTPKAGHSSSKKIPDMHASPQNHEPGHPTGARKKKLPGHRETAKGPAHLKRAPPGGHHAALQPESQRKPTPLKAPSHPDPSLPRSPQGNQREKVQIPDIPEPPDTEPVPKDAQVQEEKRGNVHHSRKKVQANLPANDLVQKGARSKKGPALKREDSGGLSQENATTLSGDQATPEGQPPHRRSPPE